MLTPRVEAFNFKGWTPFLYLNKKVCEDEIFPGTFGASHPMFDIIQLLSPHLTKLVWCALYFQTTAAIFVKLLS